MESLQKSKRLYFYVRSYGSFGSLSIVEGTAFSHSDLLSRSMTLIKIRMIAYVRT